MKHFLLCLFTLLTTDMLFAQTDLSDFYLRHFTSENGLSQNTVKSIAPDDYGFVWLATESGLLRFDGNNFKQFDKKNTGILSSRMFDIQRGTDANTLVAISGIGELLSISGGKAQKTTGGSSNVLLPGSAEKMKPRFFKWMQGQVWADSLFFHTDKTLEAMVTFQHGIIWYTNKRPTDHTYIPSLTTSKELFLFDHAIYRIAGGPAGDTLQRITPDGIRNVTFKGDFAAWQSRHRSRDYFIENSHAAGQAFLYTSQCLYLAEPLSDGSISTKLLLSGFDLNRQLIGCAYYDSLHQRIFLGSYTNGLYILERKKFYTAIYQGKGALPTINVIYDQVALNDSTVLTGNGTIFHTNPAIPPAYRNLPGYGNDPHSSPVFRSGSGNVWVCGRDRIFLMDSTATNIKKEWICPGPMTLAESKDGRIWIGTEHSGMFVLDMRDTQPELRPVLGAHQHIMSIEWEDEQFLWICTIHHLLRMNINTGTIDTLNSLTDKMARSLYIPRPGEVWICTYEDGLFLWQKGRLTHFPVTNYPYLKTVNEVLEDEQGYFWISTNHGIYQAKRADLLRYASNRGEEPYLYYYSKQSGFVTNEFNGGSPYVGVKLRNGFFSISSMNGVVFFRPSAIKAELPEEKFIIDKIEVDDREIISGTGSLVLNRNFKTLKITPVSAYMGNPANLKYEFRLNNDSEWRNTYAGSVILSSLPAGHNHIFIRRKAGFGLENYVTSELLIYVPPAWWQTRWFYILASVLLVMLIWLIIRLRVRHWKMRNQLLETAIQRRTQDLKDIIYDLEDSENRLGEQLQFQTKLNEQITHDITTPLKYLSIFTQQVSDRKEGQNDAEMQYVHQDINRIYEVVQNLGEYMRTRLLKNISGTRFNMHDLVKQKAELFKIAATASNNIIENRTDPALFIHQNESLISIVLHNLIDNAVKNTENGKIIITTMAENGRIILSISDNGRGMTPAQLQAYNDYFRTSTMDRSALNTGFGFQIIKEIAILQKLEIRVVANHSKGVDFRVLILQNEYDTLL
ncbi:ATP-binding protein [Chitinophagaceae bacterium MMS25-I14]